MTHTVARHKPDSKEGGGGGGCLAFVTYKTYLIALIFARFRKKHTCNNIFLLVNPLY